MDWIELDWDGLGWVSLDVVWIRLGFAGRGRNELNWIGFDWIELGYSGWGWIASNWIGLDWIGLEEEAARGGYNRLGGG